MKAAIRPSEYGRAGLIAVTTPQANPTVEQELLALRPAGVSLVTARLFSASPDPRRRLTDYLDELDETLARFGRLAVDVYTFACTGSTYLRGHASERAKVAELEARFGKPVITAAAAIEAELALAGATRIAVIAPYPDWLLAAGAAYWEGRGITITAADRVVLPSDDTNLIYTLGSQAALERLRAMDLNGAEAVVFSGTGMPSLRALAAARELTGLPVLSSNLCLARAAGRIIGVAPVEDGPDFERRLASL
ncbi:MAG: hypothetical protein D6727_04770 [Gammaproteobacteria bacterium]|nr:MAG: hypothetical protein D6727_04770 [Gammaproteobacteria bacterium]